MGIVDDVRMGPFVLRKGLLPGFFNLDKGVRFAKRPMEAQACLVSVPLFNRIPQGAFTARLAGTSDHRLPRLLEKNSECETSSETGENKPAQNAHTHG
jgi:hypothetical protein